MPAKKRASSKKSSSKKSAVKGGAKGASSIALQGGIPKLTLNMRLDAAKTAAIQRCLAKGTLKITVSRVDLATGRLADPWLYD